MIGYLMGKLNINMYQYTFIKEITIVKFFVHDALTPTACYVTLYIYITFFFISKNKDFCYLTSWLKLTKIYMAQQV